MNPRGEHVYCNGNVIISDDRIEGQGVAVYASRSRRYIDQAVSLAASIRLNSPGTSVALITDIKLAQWQADLFDRVFLIDYDQYPGISYRFYFDELAPFQDGNLIFDSDCLVYGSLDSIFEKLKDYDSTAFAVSEIYAKHWFDDPNRSKELYDSGSFPLIMGDVHYVRPSVTTSRLFDAVRAIANQYDELGIRRWRGGVNDEPVFALAYREMKMDLAEREPGELANTADYRCSSFSSNCLKPRVKVTLKSGAVVTPKVLHFESWSVRPSYLFEQAGLFAKVRYPSRFFARTTCRLRGKITAIRFMVRRFAERKLGWGSS